MSDAHDYPDISVEMCQLGLEAAYDELVKNAEKLWEDKSGFSFFCEGERGEFVRETVFKAESLPDLRASHPPGHVGVRWWLVDSDIVQAKRTAKLQELTYRVQHPDGGFFNGLATHTSAALACAVITVIPEEKVSHMSQFLAGYVSALDSRCIDRSFGLHFGDIVRIHAAVRQVLTGHVATTKES